MRAFFRERGTKGSILAYSLILLGIVLVASIGMMAASVTNLRSVSTGGKSVSAFQIADSGSQAVIAEIKKDSSGRIRDLIEDNDRMNLSCSGNDEAENSEFLGGGYRLSFYGGDPEVKLSCNDDVSEITSVRSVGTYQNTARAVNVAVAQTGGGGITGGCKMSGVNISERWGSGCLSSGNAAIATCASAQASNFLCGPSAIVSGETFCLCVNS